MNKNLNLVEILKDAPKGTKLWSPLCGECELVAVEENCSDPILCKTSDGNNIKFTNLGKYYSILFKNGECLLFPSKDMRDWYKFVWKKGAILVSNDGETVVMFFGWANDAYTEFFGAKFPVKKEEGKSTFNTCDFESCCQSYNIEPCINPTTREFSVKTVKITVGNSEPNEPNKPIEPKYSFKPFDKVVIRNHDNEKWSCDLFSYMEDGQAICTAGTYGFQCLPYNEETAKLIGTTKSLEDIR